MSNCRECALHFGSQIFLVMEHHFDKHYTRDEARALLPQIRKWLERLNHLREDLERFDKRMSGMTEQAAAGTWRLTLAGKEISRQPRVAVLRSLMLNHWYHHRGQLSVYLRLLDVPVPVIYGRSADENPFA